MEKLMYNVKISLTEAQARKIAPDPKEEMSAIQNAAQHSLAAIAGSGMVLPGSAVSRIEKILGKADPGKIVEAVEASAGLEGDNIVVKMTMDPVWIGELREKAVVLGMDLDTLCSEMQSQILHQGLIYDMETERIPVFFTAEQFLTVRKSLNIREDSEMFGDDIARGLGWKPGVEVEDELFARG